MALAGVEDDEMVTGTFVPEENSKSQTISTGKMCNNIVVWSDLESETHDVKFVYDCIVIDGNVKTSIVCISTSNANPTVYKQFAGNGITKAEFNESDIILSSGTSHWIAGKKYGFIAW